MTREEEMISEARKHYDIGTFLDGVAWAYEHPKSYTIAEYLYKEKGYPISLNGDIPTYEEVMKDVQIYNNDKMRQMIEKACNGLESTPNLESLWHDASEKPRAKEWLLIQFGEDDYDVLSLDDLYIDMWCTWCKTYNVIRWAYIGDLLPKGGKK